MAELFNLIRILMILNIVIMKSLVNSHENNFDKMEIFNNSEYNFLDTNFTRFNKSNKNEMTLYYESLGNVISAFMSPILLVIGAFGNLLCILVLLQKNKKNTTVIYLCILAIFDFLVLYTGLLRQYINQIWQVDIRNASQIFCKLHIFLTYTLMQISSYILVAVTLNRFTIIFNRSIFCKKNSFQANQKKSSLRSVYLIVLLITLLVSIWNFPFLYFYEKIDQPKKSNNYLSDCTIDKKKHNSYYRFRIDLYGKLHLYIFIVIPCLILLVLNLLIVRKIMYSSKKMSLNKKIARKKEKKRTALSIMLISVCLWFMVLKTPASVYITFPVQEMSKPYFPFTYNFFMLINYTNHAVNLILYIVTSSGFRSEMKNFFKNLFCQKTENNINKTMRCNVEENIKLNRTKS